MRVRVHGRRGEEGSKVRDWGTGVGAPSGIPRGGKGGAGGALRGWGDDTLAVV